ncbi:hypothetical protein B0T14DRAFT_264490 [Immersiella caudata]|uniref:Uncharacterized protein n=1 Tax=Immersiella caudata TaxID=314043 RepID=A0AA39WKW5_9PEZI|nr:hypothetical protein B0T14DRAFT_264490 [Immersiella caudata]
MWERTPGFPAVLLGWDLFSIDSDSQSCRRCAVQPHNSRFIVACHSLVPESGRGQASHFRTSAGEGLRTQVCGSRTNALTRRWTFTAFSWCFACSLSAITSASKPIIRQIRGSRSVSQFAANKNPRTSSSALGKSQATVIFRVGAVGAWLCQSASRPTFAV